MKRLGRFVAVVMLVASLAGASACQPTVEVQTGTRVVDAQGRVISEDIHTVRVPPETAGAYRIDTITQEGVAAPQPTSTPTATASASPTSPASPANPAGSADASDSAPPPPAPAGTPTSLAGWTPDTLEGFTAKKPEAGPWSMSRDYRPGPGNPVKTLVIAAWQLRDDHDAQRLLEFRVEQVYPKNASTSTVRGHVIYFGTDGHTAAISFKEGAVVITLEASPVSGRLPAMKSALERVVEQLP